MKLFLIISLLWLLFTFTVYRFAVYIYKDTIKLGEVNPSFFAAMGVSIVMCIGHTFLFIVYAILT